MIDKFDVTMPEATFPQLNLSDNLSFDLSELNNPLSGGTIPDVQDLNLSSSDLSGLTHQVSTYSDEISNVVPENMNDIPSAIEEQASEALPLEDVQKQIGEVDQLKEMASQANNPEDAQEQLKEELQQQAMDHFAGKEQQLEQAMETKSKYKKKYENVQSIADLPRKIPNPMHEKPFIERLVPGIATQIHREDAWLLISILT